MEKTNLMEKDIYTLEKNNIVLVIAGILLILFGVLFDYTQSTLVGIFLSLIGCRIKKVTKEERG